MEESGKYTDNQVYCDKGYDKVKCRVCVKSTFTVMARRPPEWLSGKTSWMSQAPMLFSTVATSHMWLLKF